MKNPLSPNHHRSVSVTIQIVEQTLYELDKLLSRQRQDAGSVSIQRTIPDGERERIREKLRVLQAMNRELSTEFQLQKKEYSESQLLRAKVVYLWTVLEDTRSQKMKKYGDIHQENARRLDEYVGNMLKVMSELHDVKETE